MSLPLGQCLSNCFANPWIDPCHNERIVRHLMIAISSPRAFFRVYNELSSSCQLTTNSSESSLNFAQSGFTQISFYIEGGSVLMETSKISVLGKMQQSLRSHPLFYYFFLAYAFSWIITIPYLLSTWRILPGDYSLVLYLKQWAGPALAAILMTRIIAGKPGQISLRNRIRQWRAGWQWYLFILLGIPALALLGVILQPGALAGFKGFQSSILMSYPLYFIGIFFATGLPEEIGWRGFALPRMQPRFGPLLSSLLLGSLWGGWHLIWFLLPTHGGGPGVSFANMLMNFSVFLMMVVALTIIFTWVFNCTQGSIFIASLLHTAIDAPQLVWLPLFLDVGASNSSTGEMGLNLAYLIVFGAVALLVLIFTRGRLGYRSSQQSPFRSGEFTSKPAL